MCEHLVSTTSEGCPYSYIYQIDGGSISWSCQKQIIVAISSTEAEFIALTHATKEALWLQHFIMEIFQPLEFPIKIIQTISQKLPLLMAINNIQGPSTSTSDYILSEI